MKNQAAKFVIVGTPGDLCADKYKDKYKWIHASDLVILPTKPLFRYMESFLRMATIIRKNLRPEAGAFYIGNMINPLYRASKDFMTWMESAIKEKREPFLDDHRWSFGCLP